MTLIIEGIKLYTVHEIGVALGVTPQTVRAWIKIGRLKAQRIGRPLLIREDSLRDFLKSNN